ncbi:Uncharacterized protein GBIM_19575 [Gryllus bimaculatus]|nr:Uncharacterized protein GBIM_19575 [Gryllus bimaculatus]
MRKLTSFFCLLAVALVNTESEVAPDNSYSAWTYFHFLNDWAKETVEPDESLDDDIDLQTEEANDTEVISPSEGHRIAGGYETNIRNHPYQVSVRKRLLRKSSYCSGSIISKNWILTAAHCTMG